MSSRYGTFLLCLLLRWKKKKKEGFKCKLLFQCHYRRNITQKCNLLCIDKTKLKNASTYSHLETTELERKVHVAFRNSSVVCSSWLDGQSYCSADVKAPDVRKEVEQTEKNWVSAKLMDVVQNLGSTDMVLCTSTRLKLHLVNGTCDENSAHKTQPRKERACVQHCVYKGRPDDIRRTMCTAFFACNF